MSQKYHEGHRTFQNEFDARRLADRVAEITSDTIHEEMETFIQRRDMFFIATADGDGRPQCSYKGGEPGFVRVVNGNTVAFPIYDGNGMFLTAGNIAVNPKVGLLFVDFAEGTRLLLNGRASVDFDDPLVGSFPGAQFVVRVEAEEGFSNCRRYVHKYELVERSTFVPSKDWKPPMPDWKHLKAFERTLPHDDPALDSDREIASSIPRF